MRKHVKTGLGLLVGMSAFALAFRNLDLRGSELLRGAAVTAFVILPTGYLLTRSVGRGLVARGERFVLACVVGYPVTAATYYFLSVLKLQAIFAVILVGTVCAACVLQARNIKALRLGDVREVATRLMHWLGSFNWLLFALLGLILLTTTRGYRAFVPVEGGLAYDHVRRDHLFHLSNCWEMLRGIPPQELPAVAGIPFAHYHVFSYILGVLLVKYGGLGVITVHHAIMPLFHFSLLAGAVYIAVRARTRSPHVAAASLVGLFFISYPLGMLLENRLIWGDVPLTYLLRSVTAVGGMVVWPTIFCLLVLYDRARREQDSSSSAVGLLYLSAVLVGLSYLFKAEVFLPLGVAYGLALLLLFLRERSPVLVGAAVVTVLTFGLLYFSWQTDWTFAELRFVPGLFAREYVFAGLKRDPIPFFQTLLAAFQAIPGGWGWIVATPFGLWRVLHFSLLVPAYFVYQMRSLRSIGLADAVLCLSLPVMLLMAYVLGSRNLYGRTNTNIVRQALYAMSLLAVVLDVVVAAALLDRCKRMTGDGGRIILAGTLVTALALSPVLLQPWSSAIADVGVDHLIVLSPGEQGALSYLRQETALDSVVISDRTDSLPVFSDSAFRESIMGRRLVLNGWAIVSGLAGRRSVLEYYDPVTDPQWDREADIRTFFSTTDVAEAVTILDRYGVNYILEYAQLPLQFALAEADVHLVYDSGDVRVYQIGEPSGGEAPEGPLYAPPGLR